MLRERDELGLGVAAVGFAEAGSLAAWRARLGLHELAVIADPERRLYGQFGFGRASVARVWLDPRVWMRYGVLIAHGHRPEAAHEDALQLGGDVLVDASGVVRWIYHSRGPEDRPSLGAIAAAARRLNR